MRNLNKMEKVVIYNACVQHKEIFMKTAIKTKTLTISKLSTANKIALKASLITVLP